MGLRLLKGVNIIQINNKLSVQGAPVSFQKALKKRLTMMSVFRSYGHLQRQDRGFMKNKNMSTCQGACQL